MMRSDPQPSSTAEKSRFSMIAVTAIHQRLANAVARVGAMVGGKKLKAEKSEEKQERQMEREGEKEREREKPA